ncbi:CsbD family protein [Euzebya sp.]|uniref:CsbD family protein n=1 Tax=Euzebya sp. TaxID=1971409 RepID=UPI0035148592
MARDDENVVEDAKGKLKEAAGALTGNDDMRDEGMAQQKKVDADEKAQEKEAEAAQARAEAAAHEAEQKKK